MLHPPSAGHKARMESVLVRANQREFVISSETWNELIESASESDSAPLLVDNFLDHDTRASLELSRAEAGELYAALTDWETEVGAQRLTDELPELVAFLAVELGSTTI